MSIHDLAFWVCTFFLLGVFVISIFKNLFLIFFITAILSLYFVLLKRYYFAVLAMFLVIGAIYFQVFDNFQKSENISFGSSGEFRGIIKNSVHSLNSQSLTVELGLPHSGRIKIQTRRFPSFNYGDLIAMSGSIEKPAIEFADYLAKDGILGVGNFSRIELVESGHGNFIKAGLLEFKGKIIETFKNFLPAQKAALLAGITLGEREDFSKEFEDEMRQSGTTHLVALSGYNISVIALAVVLFFGFYFSRSVSFYLSILAIVLFVLMTGAEASVVRAAIMGIIAILAKETERTFNLRNAISIAAFLMILYKPRLLVFDLGFQLSFLALLGIIYLMPAVKKFLQLEDSGFLNWKESALTTLSAQLAVIPLLLGKFGYFPLTSFFANILILGAIPPTMALGFITGIAGFISDFLAQIFSLIVNPLLSYEILIINLFSKFSLPIVLSGFGMMAAIIYYALLLGFIFYYDKK